jgi:small subunit ribosomal protein S1
LAPYIGQRITAKILELDRNRNNVVLSRRTLLEQNQRGARDEFLTHLKVGEVRTGRISSVVAFGAFVDLGGMDGLIHVSELSWKHVDNPTAVVNIGDEVTVKVLEVDMDRERANFMDNALKFDATLRFINGNVRTTLDAMKSPNSP